uniref:PPPDE domain-containing protein n=1 Tax=Aureoumbra lagunensis TaxID=44058 RepID=A0A7S3K2U1_9STRA|mmetsp:Transcript_20439/g.31216  ORF Transcript_20439/g.31216 Transcript_20439/m.31216 type:complete len:404 (+) Transcript_20439:47-1258(+)
MRSALEEDASKEEFTHPDAQLSNPRIVPEKNIEENEEIRENERSRSVINPLNPAEVEARRKEAVAQLSYSLHAKQKEEARSMSSVFSWRKFNKAMEGPAYSSVSEESFFYPDIIKDNDMEIPLLKISTKRELAGLNTMESKGRSTASCWYFSFSSCGELCMSQEEYNRNIIRLSPKAFERVRLEAVSPVILNVYHVGNRRSISRLNKALRDVLRLGGVFHTGVEVCGIEWSYGYCEEQRSGVFSSRPRQCPVHVYRESVYLGDCGLGALEIKSMLKLLRREWMGPDYDLLRKNCNNFTTVFSNALGLGDIPKWCNRLARLGASLDITPDIAQAVRSLNRLDDIHAIRMQRLFRSRTKVKSKSIYNDARNENDCVETTVDTNDCAPSTEIHLVKKSLSSSKEIL